MRFAIKKVISRITNYDIGESFIYVKFRLEKFHFIEIPHLVSSYADYYTLEISKNNYKTIIIDNDFFKIHTNFTSSSFKNDTENNIIKINFSSIVHFIDTKQNISIEIEDQPDYQYYHDFNARETH